MATFMRTRLASIAAIIAACAVLCVILCGCTENARARRFGGTSHVDAQAGHKVIGATWKGDDLWLLSRPMRAGDEPEVLTLRESSSWGVVEGAVVIREVDSQETARLAGR